MHSLDDITCIVCLVENRLASVYSIYCTSAFGGMRANRAHVYTQAKYKFFHFLFLQKCISSDIFSDINNCTSMLWNTFFPYYWNAKDICFVMCIDFLYYYSCVLSWTYSNRKNVSITLRKKQNKQIIMQLFL